MNQVWNQGALNVGLRLESRYVRTASMLLFTLNQALNLESLCSTHTAKSLKRLGFAGIPASLGFLCLEGFAVGGGLRPGACGKLLVTNL